MPVDYDWEAILALVEPRRRGSCKDDLTPGRRRPTAIPVRAFPVARPPPGRGGARSSRPPGAAIAAVRPPASRSSTSATPSSSFESVTSSAISITSGCAFATATPGPPRRASARRCAGRRTRPPRPPRSRARRRARRARPPCSPPPARPRPPSRPRPRPTRAVRGQLARDRGDRVHLVPGVAEDQLRRRPVEQLLGGRDRRARRRDEVPGGEPRLVRERLALDREQDPGQPLAQPADELERDLRLDLPQAQDPPGLEVEDDRAVRADRLAADAQLAGELADRFAARAR